MDRITKQQRSANMAAIRCRDTAPEIAVRRILRSLGVGYRLHGKNLPGRPDIVMRGRRRVILVHGCFWHRHDRCRFACTPKSRQDFWDDKFAATVARDLRNLRLLRESGWKVLVLWECNTTDAQMTTRQIMSFLELPLTPERSRNCASGKNQARLEAGFCATAWVRPLNKC